VAEREQPALQPEADDAVRQMVLDYAAPLYRYAFRLTGRVADAEDLVQQTFLAAQTQRDQLRDPSRLSAWLHAILRHAWCKLCRRERIHGEALSVLEANGRSAQRPEETFDRERLQTALNDLPEEFRLVVLMFFFEDLSYQEISAQLGIPIGTVMSRLSRAKQHLRRRLVPESPPRSGVARYAAESPKAAAGTHFHPLSVS
jgi:RNA polymerase sigma-70 factor (ECF subfamily)